MFDIKRKTLEWGGKTLTLETGRMARQADGAVLAIYGETMVLATAVFAKSAKPVKGFKNEVQVVATVLAHDLENDPDIVALVAASAALVISGAPFMGPIAGARVGFVNGEYVLNPTTDEMKDSRMDLVVAGTNDAVMMVESEIQEMSEDEVLKGVMFAHAGMQPVIDAIIELAEHSAKEPFDFQPEDTDAIKAEMKKAVGKDLASAFKIPAKL